MSLAPDGDNVRVKAHVTTSDGIFETLSEPVTLSVWHSVMAVLDGGILRLRVDEAETHVAVTGAVITAMGPLTIGEGYQGNLDDIQVFDLTRPRLLAFEGGANSATVTLDAAGRAQIRVESLGNLRTSSPNSWTTQLTATLRAEFGSVTTTFIGAASLEAWVGIVELAGGFIEGDPDSAAGYAGDIVASILVWGDIRDVGIAIYRHWKNTATTGDYIVLVVTLISLLAILIPPAKVFTAAAKAGAKLIDTLPPSLQRVIGLLLKDVIAPLLSKGKLVFAKAKTQLLRLVKFLAELKNFIGSLRKLQGVLRDAERLRFLIRLADDSGDLVGMINRFGKLVDTLPYDEARKTRYVGELLDLLAHQADEAVELGLGIAKPWSDEALSGAVRFMHLTADAGRQTGDLGRAKRIAEIGLEGLRVGDFHDDVAEEFFKFVGKLPDPCPGCDELVGKGIGLRGNGFNLQGAYGAVRLLSDVPDMKTAGRIIETVADKVPGRVSMKQGVDVIVRRTDVPPLPARVRFEGRPPSDQVPEFWELKYVRDLDSAIKPDQVAKHLETRVATVYQQLAAQGLDANQLQAAMATIRLKFDIILRNSPTGSVVSDKQAVLRQLQEILKQPRFKSLRDAGFKFNIDDILLRHGDPIGTNAKVASLAVLPGP